MCLLCRAKETGALIVHACGLDSVPADLGVLFNALQFKKGARPSSVESFLYLSAAPDGYSGTPRPACSIASMALTVYVVHSSAHYATWQSAVEGFSDQKTLARIRKDLKAKRSKDPVPKYVGPKLAVKTRPFRETRCGNRFAIPFPGEQASSPHACVRMGIIVAPLCSVQAPTRAWCETLSSCWPGTRTPRV